MIDGLMDGFDEAIVGTIVGQRVGFSDIETFELTLGTFDE